MEALALDHIYDFHGNKALIREINAFDKRLLLEGLHEMEPKSIYHRFFAAKKGLTAKELINLTEFDRNLHYAIGAVTATTPVHPMGTARFHILQDDKTSAEFAVTIIDKYQGMGLGKELLGMLITEAKNRGIRTLSGDMLTTNTQMIALAHSVAKTHNCRVKLVSTEPGVQKLTLSLG